MLLVPWRDLVLPVTRFGRPTVKRAGLPVAALWILAGCAVAAEERGSCTSDEIAVVYEEPSELDVACKAVGDVVRYFKPIAFQVPAMVSVRFANRNSDVAKRHSPAHALFDPLRLEIVVYRASEEKPWGQAWSRELVGSFLRHEIVHTVIWEALGPDPKRLRPEWHEFIAYAIQIDLMEPALRQLVVAAHADLGPISDLSEINEFSYGMNPEGFAVVAYKTYLDRGGPTFVRQLLTSEIKPPLLSYPFAVLPHEIPQ